MIEKLRKFNLEKLQGPITMPLWLLSTEYSLVIIYLQQSIHTVQQLYMELEIKKEKKKTLHLVFLIYACASAVAQR